MCGAERMLLNLAIGLSKTGRISPLLFIPAPDTGPLASMAAEHGIGYAEIPSPSWYFYEDQESARSYWSRIALQANGYCNVMQQYPLDVLVVNTLTSLPPVMAAMKLQIPYVAWVHGISDAGLLRRASPLSRIGEDLTLRGAAHVVACSEWTARHFRYRTAPRDVTAILNWTEVPAAAPSQRRDRAPCTHGRRFVCLSTLERHKGLDVAIRALGSLKAAGRKCFLDLYGDGGDKEWFRQIIRDEHLENEVRLRGRTTNVNEVYETSLATLFPSRIEPFGMLAIESMAARTPVIASAVGGLCEIIDDGQTGMLFESGNIQQLAACMSRLLDDPQEAERLGQAGYRKALAQFNGEVSLRKFESILLDAAAGTMYPWSAAVDQDKFILTELLDAVGGVGLLEPACTPASRDHLPVYGGQYDMRLPYDREAFENSSVVDMAAAMARAIRRRGLRRLARNAFARGSEFIQHTFSGVLRRLRHTLSKRV
jgi:glycosyltransferase involved in cell wall biosynthesis